MTTPWLRRIALGVLLGTGAAACGLVLDTSPPDPTGTSGPCTSDAACEDGNPCNGILGCAPDGTCVLVGTLTCDDGLACTTDSCDASAGACVFTPNDAACTSGQICNPNAPAVNATGCITPVACSSDATCDDGNPCNGVETCQSHLCHPGTAVVCPGQGCLAGVCDPSDGSCGFVPNDASCEDGLSCTVGSCNADGTCSRELHDSACDDGAACTSDVCVGVKVGANDVTGCFHKPDDAYCADPNAKCVDWICAPADADPTSGDGCAPRLVPNACPVGQRCNFDTDVCELLPLTCTGCDDGNPCNGTETCVTGTLGLVCTSTGHCPAPDNTCREAVCDLHTGDPVCATRIAPTLACYLAAASAP